jgi:hypothetical protein
MAVYHQANLFTGKTAWIVVGASEELQSQVVKTLPAKGDTNSESFKDLLLGNVLDTHLMIALWAQDNWSWYLQSLEEVYSKMVGKISSTPKAILLTWIIDALCQRHPLRI